MPTELAWIGESESDGYSKALANAERHQSERVRVVARDARKVVERMARQL